MKNSSVLIKRENSRRQLHKNKFYTPRGLETTQSFLSSVVHKVNNLKPMVKDKKFMERSGPYSTPKERVAKERNKALTLHCLHDDRLNTDKKANRLGLRTPGCNTGPQQLNHTDHRRTRSISCSRFKVRRGNNQSFPPPGGASIASARAKAFAGDLGTIY